MKLWNTLNISQLAAIDAAALLVTFDHRCNLPEHVSSGMMNTSVPAAHSPRAVALLFRTASS